MIQISGIRKSNHINKKYMVDTGPAGALSKLYLW